MRILWSCIPLALVGCGHRASWHELAWTEAYATSATRHGSVTGVGHPSQVLDGNPGTGWVEGVDGPGIGEVLWVPFAPPEGLRAVKVTVGTDCVFPSDPVWFPSQPASLVLQLERRGQPVGDSAKVATASGRTSEAVLRVPPGPLPDAVRVTIDQVHPARHDPYQGLPADVPRDPDRDASHLGDTCVAEVHLQGDTPAGDPPAVLDARRVQRESRAGERYDPIDLAPPPWPFASNVWVSQAADRRGLPPVVERAEAFEAHAQALEAARACPAETPDAVPDEWEPPTLAFDERWYPLLAGDEVSWTPGGDRFRVCREEGRITRIRFEDGEDVALAVLGDDGHVQTIVAEDVLRGRHYLKRRTVLSLQYDARGRIAAVQERESRSKDPRDETWTVSTSEARAVSWVPSGP